MDDSTTDSETTFRGGSGVCDSQRGGRQDTVANGRDRVLDIPGDMAIGRYVGVTSEGGKC